MLSRIQIHRRSHSAVSFLSTPISKSAQISRTPLLVRFNAFAFIILLETQSAILGKADISESPLARQDLDCQSVKLHVELCAPLNVWASKPLRSFLSQIVIPCTFKWLMRLTVLVLLHLPSHIFIQTRSWILHSAVKACASKYIMQDAKVPVVPGYSENQDPAYLKSEADKMGYKLLIKAVKGGGKGMRIVQSADRFYEMLRVFQARGLKSFSDDKVLVGKSTLPDLVMLKFKYLPTIVHSEDRTEALRVLRKALGEFEVSSNL
ncbi:methylcrotonoyl-CoA carboxylase subunit alpha, mitochondrial [Batrachochytrium salamandrivorans]|nr:methylcrotonoyl-CoA carboxylase subunit alpha, mitochondrial [Batrachochytrium salamandrivorans]